MEIDKSALVQNYSAKSDEELLALHAAGALTETAYEVLEAELTHRGLAIPKRPETPAAPPGRPQSLIAHWEGKASLASAYWLVGVLGSAVFSVFFKLAAHPAAHSIAGLLIFIAYCPYAIFALVSIWRCAWNSSWRVWGYIARALVVVNGLMLLFYLIELQGRFLK